MNHRGEVSSFVRCQEKCFTKFGSVATLTRTTFDNCHYPPNSLATRRARLCLQRRISLDTVTKPHSPLLMHIHHLSYRFLLPSDHTAVKVHRLHRLCLVPACHIPLLVLLRLRPSRAASTGSGITRSCRRVLGQCQLSFLGLWPQQCRPVPQPPSLFGPLGSTFVVKLSLFILTPRIFHIPPVAIHQQREQARSSSAVGVESEASNMNSRTLKGHCQAYPPEADNAVDDTPVPDYSQMMAALPPFRHCPLS